DHVLAGVQNQQQPAPASACETRCAVTTPPPRSSPIAAATATGTRPGSANGENSASHTPSANCDRSRRAAARASRDAAGAGQRDEPMHGGKAQDVVENVIPANQLGNRLRQICRRQFPRDPPVETALAGIRRRGGYCCAGIGLRVSGYGADRAGELVAA